MSDFLTRDSEHIEHIQAMHVRQESGTMMGKQVLVV